MKKADHLKFLELFDKAALALGARKFIYHEAHPGSTAPQLDGYEFQTVHGPLTLHPDKPWKVDPQDKSRMKYTVDVFGRFTGDGPYPHDANRFSGKWNFHYGPREGWQIQESVDLIMGSVLRYLNQKSIDTKSRP